MVVHIAEANKTACCAWPTELCFCLCNVHVTTRVNASTKAVEPVHNKM